ncbi:MAG: DUF1501 domain-containing protein [Tepidimonas sp.]|uniref:DUF1501 domain-containing protein n=1 Tax=Tepidimonas sp. TaxID=2002775 RepID=UPI0040553141
MTSLLGISAWLALPAQAATATSADGRLVVVFLRGAYDGLSALVPWSDPDYARLRPTIAIPAPGTGDGAALQLDAHFALHPALAPLLPLWQAGVLAAIPCAGSPDPTRSHFDAQRHWEVGIPGISSAHDGWLNTLAAEHPGSRALGVGEANPLILRGAAPVQLVPRGQAATRAGVVGVDASRSAVLRLDSGDDALSQAFRAGADRRLETSRALAQAQVAAEPGVAASDGMMAANNGAGSVRGLRLDAQHLATLMRRDPALRWGFLSAGGWDTHVNQGAARGALANNLATLAEALVQLRQDFNRPNDVVAVVSEFGRTAAENGSRGTDHGHGNTLWLMGDAVAGGRWHGRWDGLAASALHQGRDLPVHHDFRAVFARVLSRIAGLNETQAQRLFPGYRADPALAGLMRG